MGLRQFQREDVDFLKKHGLRALVASAPGTGKTVVAIMALAETHEKSFPAVIVCPASVTLNWEREFKKWAPGVQVARLGDGNSPLPRPVRAAVVYIISWALLDARWPDLVRAGVKTVIADECFPAGTKVETAKGPVSIETLRPGDLVWAVSEGESPRLQPVLRTLRKTLREKLVIVHHEHGSVVCTAKHKIWTEEDGYVEAGRLGDHHLRVVQQEGEKELVQQSTSALLRPEVLGPLALDNRGGSNTPSSMRAREPRHPSPAASRFAGEDAPGQPYERCGYTGEDDPDSSAHRASPPCPKGERYGPDRVRAASQSSHRTSAADSHSAQGVAKGLPNAQSLQGRPGLPAGSSRGGAKRVLPLGAEPAGARSKKGLRFISSRVDRVEAHESGGSGRSGASSDEGTFVYDLEVAEDHNYIAEGVLVSNCHYAKNPESLRSRALFQLTRPVEGVILLSGTPIVNNTAELAVLNGLLGSESPPMIRRLLEDVAPDIPEKKRSYLYVKPRSKHQSEYDRADDDFETWLRKEKEKLLGEGMAEYEVERTLAAEALAKIGYLRRLVGKAKVPAAVDWISRAVRIGEPVVVFLEHQNVLKALVKGLRRQRIRCGVLEGSTSTKKRQALIDGFQRNAFPVFIGTRAAKEGITLTAARHLLFVERFFTSADEEQAEDRIRRIGQTHKTTIWLMHAPGTVDDRVDAIVQSKRQIIRTAIGSADIMETSTSNVESLIKHWGDHSSVAHTIQPLGIGEPLPPLPNPRDTHAIVFSGERWTARAAVGWCRMHGYLPQKHVPLGNRFKLVLHPAVVFRPGEFASFRVCRDIRIITGPRLGKANERLQRMGR